MSDLKKSNNLIQDNQKNDKPRRLAGCIPYDGKSEQFILITSRRHENTPHEDFQKAAMRETWEEAGIKGVIREYVGVFAEKVGPVTVALCHVYALEIKDVAGKFPEKHERRRRWFAFDDAIETVIEPHIKAATRLAAVKIRTKKLITPEAYDHSITKDEGVEGSDGQETFSNPLLRFEDLLIFADAAASASKASDLSKISESSKTSGSSKTSRLTEISKFSEIAQSSQNTSVEMDCSSSSDTTQKEKEPKVDKTPITDTNPIKIWKDKDLFAPIINPDQVRGKSYAVLLEERFERMRIGNEKKGDGP
ncbi:hypothetical protein DFQ29_004860 [Apophysomyces sp. BC1021]|nr:hypothetical protein DFQ29_004860 [Apophysomyces sp. BC1021]